jgi:hypothetical protein
VRENANVRAHESAMGLLNKSKQDTQLDPARLKAMRSIIPLLWLALGLEVVMFWLAYPVLSTGVILLFFLILAGNVAALIYAFQRTKVQESAP